MNVFSKLQNTFTDDVFLLVALANVISTYEVKALIRLS